MRILYRVSINYYITNSGWEKEQKVNPNSFSVIIILIMVKITQIIITRHSVNFQSIGVH